MLRRIESALRAVPRHRRREALSCASSLRIALDGRLTLGLERALAHLPDDQDDSRWLARAAALLSAQADARSPHDRVGRAARVRAIILFAPD